MNLKQYTINFNFSNEIRSKIKEFLKDRNISYRNYTKTITLAAASKNHSDYDEIIKLFDQTITRPMFKLAKNYEEVLTLYYMFIQGEFASTPLHGWPLYSESASQIPQFIELYKYGIITTDGQQGLYKPSYPSEGIQRAYLSFQIPTSSHIYQKLKNGLINSKDILVHMNLEEQTKDWIISPVNYINNELILDHKPKHNEILEINKHKILPMTMTLKDDNWVIYTRFFFDTNLEDDLNIYEGTSVQYQPNVARFQVFHTKLGKTNLLDLILQILKK